MAGAVAAAGAATSFSGGAPLGAVSGDVSLLRLAAIYDGTLLEAAWVPFGLGSGSGSGSPSSASGS